MDLASLQVPPDRLSVYCDPDTLGFETTEEVSPLEGTVGQDRAIKALEFGLSIDAPGYNIYVAGYPGTGRTTTLASFLKQTAAQRDVPNDWCYVHNFRDPLKPVAVSLPPGMGRALARDIEAVREKKFTIYAVERVEEGIEILTGVPAGEPDGDGAYPEGTVNYWIVQNLEHLAAKAKELMGRDGASGEADPPPA